MLQCFWLQYVLGWSSAFAGICLFCYQYLVALWWFSLMIIMVVSDRQHLTFISFFCNPAVSSNLFLCSVLTWLLCSSFCVRENYFWQLFLVFPPQDIDNYCIYRDYTVKLKTFNTHFVPFIIGFCMWNRSYWKFIPEVICVSEDKWNHFKCIFVWFMSLKLTSWMCFRK